MSLRELSTLVECVAGCCCCVFGAVMVAIGLVAVCVMSTVYGKPSEYEKSQLTGKQIGMALMGLGFVTLLSVGLYGIIKYFNRRMRRKQIRIHFQEQLRTCPVASAIYGFHDLSVLVGAEGYFGRLCSRATPFTLPPTIPQNSGSNLQRRVRVWGLTSFNRFDETSSLLRRGGEEGGLSGTFCRDKCAFVFSGTCNHKTQLIVNSLSVLICNLHRLVMDGAQCPRKCIIIGAVMVIVGLTSLGISSYEPNFPENGMRKFAISALIAGSSILLILAIMSFLRNKWKLEARNRTIHEYIQSGYKPDLLVIDSPFYCKSHALEHSTTEVGI
uniref:Uncharacterized protein n=1 Tax=Timema cristinae TaxID=61476 RepID=A0A7R9GXD1_TIMCR|nr:unnamed protein product [Timema cristinae]